MNTHGGFPPALIELLRQAVSAMGPYQKQLVLIGGLAPFVYQYHAAADSGIPLPPFGTKDADMAVPLPLPIIAGDTLHRCLLNGGLVSDVGRGTDGKDSITRFFLSGERGRNAPYLEFLVRDPGRHREQEGKPQPDLLAHTGDFMELLLAPTPAWEVQVPQIGTVHVPHPIGYIAQKTRMYDMVGPRWAKDQGDVVQVIWTFHPIWTQMAAVWHDLMLRKPQSSWLDRVMKIWLRLYAQPDGEGPVAVAEIYRTRATMNVSPAAIHHVMQDFIKVLQVASRP
jgi:hypothetical protein